MNYLWAFKHLGKWLLLTTVWNSESSNIGKICSRFGRELDVVVTAALDRFPPSWTGWWFWWARIWRPDAVRFQYHASWWPAMGSLTILFLTAVGNRCQLNFHRCMQCAWNFLNMVIQHAIGMHQYWPDARFELVQFFVALVSIFAASLNWKECGESIVWLNSLVPIKIA
jgi:hypothetical protein